MGQDCSHRLIEGAVVTTVGAGSGPPVVLLHANGGSALDYLAVEEHLARHSVVHAIDWPGHGLAAPAAERPQPAPSTPAAPSASAAPSESPAPTASAAPTACGFAELLPRVLDALGDGPYVLVGNSVGGFAALRTAATRPDLVAGLVLVSPGGFTPRWPTTFAACAFIASRPVTPRAMRLLPRCYLRRRNPFVAAILERADAAAADPRAAAVYASLWRSFTDRCHDARADAAQVAAPTLLAWGRRDPVLPWLVDGRRARRAMPGAEVVTFPCGHQPYAELPEQFLAAADGFFQRHGLVR